VSKLTDRELVALAHDWQGLFARPEQRIPAGDWTYWLIKAGRGYGKTRTGAETVRQWVADGHQFVNLVGATADDARDIMIEGESGILAICPPWERPEYKPSQRKLIWPNGATSLIFTADEPERLRGKQSSKGWLDEVAAWRYPEALDQFKFGLRLGTRPQAVITTTPRPTKIIRDLIADPGTLVTHMTTERI
jgi:phage terminase large subunit-like protein